MIGSTDFQTPIPVCEYMAGLVPAGAKKLFEPTPGIGNLVGVLRKDPELIVETPDNFFDIDTSKCRFDCIVMNPPFSSKYAFGLPEGAETGMRTGYFILTECMKMSDSVIALMPWFTISDSDVRLRFLKSWGIMSITALPRKTFQYARIQTVVLKLSKGFQGHTIFNTFNF